MSELYFIAPENADAARRGRAILTDAEARHLTRVMRGKVGDEIALFDGSGVEYRARVAQIGRDRVELDVLETIADEREPSVAVTAIVALPKGDRQKWAIEKLTELGVRRFVPLECERSDVKISDSARERLERQTLEASKQCGRLRLMSIAPALEFSELSAFVETLDARLANESVLSPRAQNLKERFGDDLFDEFRPGSRVLRAIAHPASDGDFGQLSFASWSRALGGAAPDGALILVGPAGGFSRAEVRAAVDGGWKPLDLGRQIYRVETAALVAAALFLHMT